MTEIFNLKVGDLCGYLNDKYRFGDWCQYLYCDFSNYTKVEI